MRLTTPSRSSPSEAGAAPPAERVAPAAAPGRAPGQLMIVAVDEAGRPLDVRGLEGLAAAVAAGHRVWVDLADPDPVTLERVAAIVGLHPLVLEDISERNERAKMARLDGYLHLVLFAIRFEGEVVESEIDFVLGERLLISAHAGEWDPHRAPQLRPGAAALLAEGPDLLLHAMTDWLVDEYFPVLDRLTDEIDGLQDEIFTRTSPWTLERLFVLKRELITLRRATAPAREIFNQLTNRELALIQPRHVIYYRDVYDHLIRVTDELDGYRELIATTLDVYLTSVNNNLSNIMKRLTGVTVILAGVGAVGGLFGMSEAGTALAGEEGIGFWIVVAATVTTAALVAVFLRRIDWI